MENAQEEVSQKEWHAGGLDFEPTFLSHVPWETLPHRHLPKRSANILLMLPISEDNPFSPNPDLNLK